ncbi:MAG TPA: orotidine-5'-phosphate decarboxylase [Pirellulales bacterium]|nr:orotidine-5'-phosphate decarboxylase [Pirellulales bacterium]
MQQPSKQLGHFADRLMAAVRAKHTPVVVGLDPRWEQLPPPLTTGIALGDRASMAKVYFRFCADVIDVVAGLVPAVKPQAAFFEHLGPDGMVALGEVIRHARANDLLVILDGKRNDIGSTATAYADGYLGAESGWQADAITVSPYLGSDSIQPFVDVAAKRGAGVFVLVKTSNLGGGQFQDLVADGEPLYRRVAVFVEQLAGETVGEEGYGAVGAVVGATYPDQLNELRSVMPSAWLLVPGYGSQGGTGRDVAGAFDEEGLGAVVNNSRGIIFAHSRRGYEERFGAQRWQEAVAAAAREMIDELRAETKAGRL